MLADLGADVVRIERGDPSGPRAPQPWDGVLRGQRLVVADLKSDAGRETVLRFADAADVLIEGFRPGVAERLGLGPNDMSARNPRLVYARMTGWGQDGPLAQAAGHDINYIGLTGGLDAFRVDGGRPVPPLNMFGDYGGGSAFLVVGVMSALWERERSGQGQVVDAAILDGSSVLLQAIWALRDGGMWSDRPGTNVLDTGAPFYDTYVCKDGKYVAVGALEPQFFAALVEGLDLAGEQLPAQYDPAGWPTLRERFAATFATRTRDEWADLFAGRDACVTPVLTFAEVAHHPHVRARGSVVEVDGTTQAAPAPRFSRSKVSAPPGPPLVTEPATILADWRHDSAGERTRSSTA
ncbi:CaiB/BaiF CoA-transferase family protein [Sporichthya brevicatena]|uniref:CaiB/BaiF CoA-transferase family protein n=2 Tax=Sporichthya brevicatena TaxID=171442 RepID=A0ABN1G437_9ACTN